MGSKRRVLLICLAIFVAVGVLLLSGGNTSTSAGQKSYEFTLGASDAAGMPTGELWVWFKDKVERYSQGRIKINLRIGSSLCNEGSCIEQLKTGAIDMGKISTSNYLAFSDTLTLLEMPYVFRSFEAAKNAAIGPVGDLLRKDVEEKDNLKLLVIFSCNGFRNVYQNSKELRAPSDMRGIKIRVTLNPISSECIKKWGGTPLNVPWAELYQGLQTKVVNGFMLPDNWVKVLKFYEVTPYCTETMHTFCYCVMFMDLKKYKALPRDLQLVLYQAAKEVELRQWEENEKEIKEAKRILKEKHGVKFYTPTPEGMKIWAGPAKGIWREYEDKLNQQALKLITDMQR